MSTGELPGMPHFLHNPHRYFDPQFLHEERLYTERGQAALHVMERHRDQVVEDIQKARSLARRAHIPINPPIEAGTPRRLALIGIGDRLRSDDGAGLEVARRLRFADPPGVVILEQEGEPASLLEAWSEADEALVIDGVSSDSEPGTLHSFEISDQPLSAELFRPTTGTAGIAEAIELARELNRLPKRLVVYGIVGESFEAGEGLTPTVQQTVDRLVTELYRELEGAS